MRTFETGATRDREEGKLDYEGFLSPSVLHRYAQYMHKHRVQADGSVRDSDNWQKGIPREAYMKSMWRHFMDVWTAWRNVGANPMTPYGFQDALCALLFNVMGMLHETLKDQPVANHSQPAWKWEDSNVHSSASPWAFNAVPLPQDLGPRQSVPGQAVLPKFNSTEYV